MKCSFVFLHSTPPAVAVVLLFTLCCLMRSTSAITCYTCYGQSWNQEECIKKTVKCEQGQDTCISIVQWKMPDEYSQWRSRRYYVDKGCEVAANCALQQQQMGDKCRKTWQTDWTCVSCCQGEHCNYDMAFNENAAQNIRIVSLVLLFHSMT